MAFSGQPVVKQVTDRMVRITGVFLAGSASDVIALHGAVTPPVGAIILPEGFIASTYDYANIPGVVTLQDCIDVQAKIAATGATTSVPIATIKTGTTPADFRATLTNGDEDGATALLEIYVRNHD